MHEQSHVASTPGRRRWLMSVGSGLMLGSGLITRPVQAALAVGAVAPAFTADAALAGKDVRFSLAESLQNGLVVLYFYPKAFTSGCTVEAHLFAQASEQFAALGATVIGMSNDDIATLRRFSVEACRNRFAVAADPGARIMKLYDAGLGWLPNTADRISYVISPAGRIIHVYASMSPEQHVQSTLQAVTQWRNDHPSR